MLILEVVVADRSFALRSMAILLSLLWRYGTERMQICGKARVACRKTIGGKRRAWAKPGSTVTVYWISEEWAVTSKGFIASRWLEVP
jgi:hypothetical protein